MPNPSTLAAADEAQSDLELQTVSKMFDDKMTLIRRISELEACNKDLSSALSQLGKQRLEMEESRDRNLKQNCDSTQTIRDLASVARASARFFETKAAYSSAEEDELFGTGPGPTDTQTEEVSQAEGDVEALLTKFMALYQR